MRVTSLIHVCGVGKTLRNTMHSYVRHDSFTCVICPGKFTSLYNYVNIKMYVPIYIHVFTLSYVRIYRGRPVYAYMYIYKHIYIYTYTCANTYTFTYTYVYIYTHLFTCFMYVYVQVCLET